MILIRIIFMAIYIYIRKKLQSTFRLFYLFIMKTQNLYVVIFLCFDVLIYGNKLKMILIETK